MTLHLPRCPCQKPGSASWHTFSMTHVSSLLAKEVKVKVTQSCPTFCDTMDYRVHGILQARTLEWVAFPFSRGSSRPRNQTRVSCIAGGFFTNWVTREAPICQSGLFCGGLSWTPSEVCIIITAILLIDKKHPIFILRVDWLNKGRRSQWNTSH